ncbi:unnamed protein product [Cylicocyclus nassatus]|uniref:Uncharacterized protein n=1 Tax=Cylicocyclus nassatus TaxID=53992 RepID=A0AA36GSX7_CYLNA|nr:unnamed protein product [Cylicocyclus nassatus]
MIFSDGQTDNWKGGDGDGNYENLRRKQVVEAEAIRKAGIRIIYIYVATYDAFLANARNVGGSGLVYVGDYRNLRKFAGETLTKVCTPVV